MNKNDLDQSVIDLHTIARKLENILNKENKVVLDIRHCADRLSVIVKEKINQDKYTKGNQ